MPERGQSERAPGPPSAAGLPLQLRHELSEREVEIIELVATGLPPVALKVKDGTPV